jgi:hypothetical protein
MERPALIIHDRAELTAGPGLSVMPLKAEGKSAHWHLPPWAFARIDRAAPHVIQAPKPEPRIVPYELTDHEWPAINAAEQAAPACPRG